MPPPEEVLYPFWMFTPSMVTAVPASVRRGSHVRVPSMAAWARPGHCWMVSGSVGLLAAVVTATCSAIVPATSMVLPPELDT